jgi:hypothetical protein
LINEFSKLKRPENIFKNVVVRRKSKYISKDPEPDPDTELRIQNVSTALLLTEIPPKSSFAFLRYPVLLAKTIHKIYR